MEELQNVKCLFPFGGIALCASWALQESSVVVTCMLCYFEHRKHCMHNALMSSLIDAYSEQLIH